MLAPSRAAPLPKSSNSEATAATNTVHFAITLSGKAVFSDPSQRFTLLSMEGDLKRPDGIRATLKVRGGGSLIEVRTVSLAGKQYVTNPINRQWLCAAPGDLFDPVVLFDPQQGVEHLLRDRFENVSLVGIEELNGRPHYHLRGTFPGEALLPISYNSLGAGDVAADVWADQETLRASQLTLVDGATDTTKPSTWQIVFSNYNDAVDVRPPTQC